MDKKPRVLFLSAGNSTRSQMAEGFLRSAGSGRFDVASAGIESNTGINPLAVEVMAQDGIDISKQQSKNVAQSLKEHFAYVITLCDEAREQCPIFPFTPNLLHWNLPDPSLSKASREQMLPAFRQVRDQIKTRIQGFLQEATENLERLEKKQAAS